MTAHISRGRAALGAVLLAWCTISAQSSWALGLDEIEVTSALNERFSATIDLLDTQGFQPTEIVVKMAGREDFDRIGVERFFFLTDLRFKVEPDANGDAQVVVTSTKPVSEPYLNFIVEVLWPSGRLLKEYTVLLDPPNFSQASAPLVDRPTVAAAPSQPVQTQPEPVQQNRPATRVNLDAAAAPSAAPDRTTTDFDPADGVMTTVDDTLWKIANRTRVDQVTVNQQMMALQRLNPRAFIRGNINLLKAGYQLDVPSVPEATAISSAQADALVAEHTQAWRERRSLVADAAPALTDQAGEDRSLASQVDATPVDIDTSPVASSGEGQVRIVANSGELGGATGSGTEVTALIEERAALSRQVEELSGQLDAEKELASNQVAVKDRQLEVKNQEIAQLQEQLSEMRSEMQKIAQSQNQSPRQSAPEPVPFWQTPMVLFGVIGVLILALVLLLVLLRRNRAEAQALEAYIDEHPDEPEYEAEEALAIADTETDSTDQVEDEAPTDQAIEPTISEHEVLTLDDDEADVAEDEPADDFVTAEEDDSGETSDVIGEAEIYIAYGRYGQAANLLLGVLNKEPERHDVRLKLLETYVESQDDENFAEHAQYLLQHTDDEDVLHACRELEAQLNDSRVVLDDEAGASADDLEPAPAEEDDAAADEQLDLDLDDLEPLDSEADEAAQASADEDFTLEFDDSFDDAPGTDAAEASSTTDGADQPSVATGQGDELGGDLGMDFDPERDVADYPVADGDDGELDDLLSDLDEETTDAADGEEFELDLDDPVSDSVEADLQDLSAAEADGPEIESEADTEAAPDASAAADEDDGFDFGAADEDVNETKLDLASAYIDMGDQDGAKDILDEVVQEGNEAQQAKAKELLDQLA